MSDIYIYIYIIIIIIKACWHHRSLSFSFVMHPNWPLLLLSPPDGIQGLHRANECKFLLINQHWWVCIMESIGKWMSLMSLSLLHQQSPSCFTHLTWTSWEIGVKLLFCRVLLPGFIQNIMQHSYIVPIWLFLQAFPLSGATL